VSRRERDRLGRSILGGRRNCRAPAREESRCRRCLHVAFSVPGSADRAAGERDEGSLPIPNARCGKVQFALTVPTVRDRVVQMATKIVIEPIFEADFQPCSYGFRPKRSATEALEAIRMAGNQGYNFVVDADIQGYLDRVPQCPLIHEIAPVDRPLL